MEGLRRLVRRRGRMNCDGWVVEEGMCGLGVLELMGVYSMNQLLVGRRDV